MAGLPSKTFSAGLLSIVSCLVFLGSSEAGGLKKADQPSSYIESKDWLPDGWMHDSGSHRHGVILKHALPIRNPTDGPIEIVSARVGPGPMAVQIEKKRLASREETKLHISVDTNRFRGKRVQSIYVTAQTSDGKLLEFRFIVSGESKDTLP